MDRITFWFTLISVSCVWVSTVSCDVNNNGCSYVSERKSVVINEDSSTISEIHIRHNTEVRCAFSRNTRGGQKVRIFYGKNDVIG